MNLKRTFDIAASGLGLIITSPIIAVTSLAMLAVHRGQSPFFMQERMGKDGKPFKIIKIKSMTDTFNEFSNVDERVSKAGVFIRKTKLDELPQLINVLKGEMSIVGPRPLPRNEHVAGSGVLSVTPGMTGQYQIQNTNEISVEDRSKIDMQYIQAITPMNQVERLQYDLSIIAKTPASIIKNWKVSHYRKETSLPRNYDQ